jgi:hypothetical protein
MSILIVRETKIFSEGGWKGNLKKLMNGEHEGSSSLKVDWGAS